MPSILSTIGYVTEASRITSSSYTNITRGVIACNRPKHSGSLFINFISFDNSEDQKVDESYNYQVINPHFVYLFRGKFIYNRSVGPSKETKQKNKKNHHSPLP